MKLGQRIRLLREKKGLTGSELAKRARLHPSQLSNLENENAQPPRDVLKYELLAEALGVDLQELWTIGQEDRREWQAKEKLRQAQILKPGIAGTPRIPILSAIPTDIPQERSDLYYPPEIAEDYYEFKVNNPNAFFLRAEGDCMTPEIKKGDLLLIYPNQKLENGDIAAVVNSKGEKEVRRITLREDQVILTPDNPVCPIIVWEAKEKPEIIGRVKEIIRRR